MNHDNLHKSLDSLLDKYKENEYITGRLETYITQLLPSALESANLNYEVREERKNSLSHQRNEFIERFMHKNKNYYCPVNKLFLQYDGLHFVGYGEDDIQHKILSTITQERILTAWKYKINNEIIRVIKTRSPLLAIPDSFTIQHTINMFIPNLFSSKYKTKYFLTLLGDNILGKTPRNIVYIISPSTKEIIQEIGHLWNMHFGPNNIVQNIKYKYYEHEYSNCRLLHINEEFTSTYKNVASDISKYIIDVMCIAAHYSNRYGSADNYLKNCSDSEFVNHTLYLTTRTSEQIVDIFIDECVVKCKGSHMDTKNMIFIWKKFLKEKKLPSIIFYEPLKSIFKSKFEYNASTDSFLNVTSLSLPLVATFIKFWDTTCQSDENDMEIDELCFLFKKWTNKSSIQVTENFLIELIRHFYPSVDIENDKYILNIGSTLWNKQAEVANYLELYKFHTIDTKCVATLCSAYEYYITSCNSNTNIIYRVSKRYFEKVAMEELGGNLDIDGIISWKS